MTRLEYSHPIPHRIMDQVWDDICFEPADAYLGRYIQQLLETRWPGPVWTVDMVAGTIMIQMQFQDPRLLTEFLLRWA